QATPLVDSFRLANGAEVRGYRELCPQLRYRGVSGSPDLLRQPLVSAGCWRLLSAARPARSPVGVMPVYIAATRCAEEKPRWISKRIRARLPRRRRPMA